MLKPYGLCAYGAWILQHIVLAKTQVLESDNPASKSDFTSLELGEPDKIP